MPVKTIKITIPAQTVEVDVEAWANEFGVDQKAVRDDVKAYFRTWCEEQVALLGLGPK